MYDHAKFLVDLEKFVGFQTIVQQNPAEFRRAYEWIRAFFDPARTEFVDYEFGGCLSLIIKPKDSATPRLLGDGHIEVVPGPNSLFSLHQENGRLLGRGVADMKTQCLMMMTVLKELIADGRHADFWLLFTEDEEAGSAFGVKQMVNILADRGWLPPLIFAPDGGPNFSYVEKEKGILRFEAVAQGRAAHASRPFLGQNAINQMLAFSRALQADFPDPREESDWIPSVAMTLISGGEAFNQIPDICTAGFDMRFTEKESPEVLASKIEQKAASYDVTIQFLDISPATYYPKEKPAARRYLDILRQAAGREPEILHANGASNGRFYVAKNPDIHVLMSSPEVGNSHAAGEYLLEDSLPGYYHLVKETARLPLFGEE